jgi:hypothetical protein
MIANQTNKKWREQYLDVFCCVADPGQAEVYNKVLSLPMNQINYKMNVKKMIVKHTDIAACFICG